MIRTLARLSLGASLTLLTFPPDVSAGRGGGYRGGGGGYGGGGEYRGGGGGGEYHGGEGGGMSHSPSFSQPHSESGYSSSGNHYSNSGSTGSGGSSADHSQASSYANSNSERSGSSSGNRNQPGGSNAGAAAAGAGYANNNKSGVSSAGAAAAGAGAANHNQSPTHSNVGAAAAGAGYANNTKSGVSNTGAGAAGAGYANRNQSGNYPNAGAAAAGAGYSNRNQSGNYPNAGAAAAGAGYANRNQSGNYPNAGAAVAGAAYANNNGYNQYQTSAGAGYWNGNYGMGSYGGMGLTSPSYGYGSTAYSNPYVGSDLAVGGSQTGNQAQPANPSGFDYSQPVNPAAAPPDLTATTDPSVSPAAQAHQAFGTGDYASAAQLTQQALAQAPNDVNLHELYALELFAQGNFEQAAAPLYAVLSVGPGWNWTTLISNYTDASLYTGQLRALEAFVRANPGSAKAQFVLAYQYISAGHGAAAIGPLEAVVNIRPSDQVSAQLLAKLQPPSPTPSVAAQTLDPSMIPGLWVAQAPPNGTINLSMNGDSTFTWTFASPGKPSMTISGPYSLDNNVLTLAGKDTPGGPLVGNVALTDANHLSFKKLGAPASDPGLQFIR